MIYCKGNFYLDCDFDIRVVREEGDDIDLFIPLDNRTLNLNLDSTVYLNSRIQFPAVRNVIIRYSADLKNNVATIHLLRNIDFQSSLANFEVFYENRVINIKDKKFFVEMSISDIE